jgi:predicted regulator of Ras-like GTPase activity (Roadblock/LC7/MglB family)
MDNEAYKSALRDSLTEIAKACPDVTTIFMFNEDGDIINGEGKTPEETAVGTVDALDEILTKALAIGGVETIVVDANNGQVRISRMEDSYLVTATSKKADVDYVNTLAHAVVPTVIKVLKKLSLTPLNNNFSEPESELTAELRIEPEKSDAEPGQRPVSGHVEEPKMEERAENLKSKVNVEQGLTEAQVNQFIVEDLKGLLVPSDTVRIDSKLLSQWEELYDNMMIEEAVVETFAGKSTRCKLKPIKDPKSEGKGIIQIPEKIRETLEVRKGELVRVKPVVE